MFLSDLTASQWIYLILLILYDAIKYPIVGFFTGSYITIIGRGDLYHLFLILYLPCLILISIERRKTWLKLIPGITWLFCLVFLGLVGPDIAKDNIFIFIGSTIIWVLLIKQIYRVYLHLKKIKTD